jgi:hypothetical protein
MEQENENDVLFCVAYNKENGDLINSFYGDAYNLLVLLTSEAENDASLEVQENIKNSICTLALNIAGNDKHWKNVFKKEIAKM